MAIFLSAALATASPNPNPPVVITALPPVVAITTTGNLRLIQSPGQTEIKIGAEVDTPGQITWEVAGPGKAYVTEKADKTGPSTSVLHLRLDKEGNAKWKEWRKDTKVTVTAKSQGAQASTDVKMLKFRRGDDTAAGSNPVYVDLDYQAAKIGWGFAGIPKNSFVFLPEEKLYYGLKEVEVKSEKKPGGEGKSMDYDGKLKVYYSGSTDTGDGKFTLSESVSFRTAFWLKGTFTDKDPKKVEMNLEAAAVAKFASERITFTLDGAGAGRVKRPPMDNPPALKPVSKKLDVSAAEAVEVKYTPEYGTQDVHWAPQSKPVERGLSYEKIPQGAQAPIDEGKAFQIQARAQLFQAGGWKMEAAGGAAITVKSLTWEMKFQPDF